MPIESSGGVATHYGVSMLVKSKQQQQQQGENAVKLIETAQVRSQEVQKLRHPDSTISVVA